MSLALQILSFEFVFVRLFELAKDEFRVATGALTQSGYQPVNAMFPQPSGHAAAGPQRSDDQRDVFVRQSDPVVAHDLMVPLAPGKRNGTNSVPLGPPWD